MAESGRTLVIMRHAKSAYPEGVDDADRPLSSRGEDDARQCGQTLAGMPLPDLVLCSPATRSRATWEIVEAALAGPLEVRYEPSMYLASARTVLGLVRSAGADLRQLLVVGHNPGMHELANALVGSGDKDLRQRLEAKLPTCGVAVLSVKGEWSGLDEGMARLERFEVPRG